MMNDELGVYGVTQIGCEIVMFGLFRKRKAAGPRGSGDAQIYRPDPLFRPSYPPITGSEIDEFIANGALVALHLWASWNGYDIPAERNLLSAVAQFDAPPRLRAVDTDDVANSEFCHRLKVPNIPAVYIYRGGTLRQKVIGLRSAHEYASAFGAASE